MRMPTGNTVGLYHVRATPTRDGTPLKGVQLYTHGLQFSDGLRGPQDTSTVEDGWVLKSRRRGRRGRRGKRWPEEQRGRGEERGREKMRGGTVTEGESHGEEQRKAGRKWCQPRETYACPPSRTGCDSCLTGTCSCFTNNGQGRGLLAPTAGPELKDSAPRQTDLCNYEIRKKNLLDFVIRLILSWRLITQLSLNWRYMCRRCKKDKCHQ